MKRISQATLKAARKVVVKAVGRYEEETGVGPCGALAILMARAGWGTLAVCESRDKDSRDEYAWFPHYLVMNAGKVLDISGEYCGGKGTPVYREVEAVKESDIIGGGMGCLYGQSDLDFWATELKAIL